MACTNEQRILHMNILYKQDAWLAPVTVEVNCVINKGLQGCRRVYCCAPVDHMAHSTAEHFSSIQLEAVPLGLHWDRLSIIADELNLIY